MAISNVAIDQQDGCSSTDGLTQVRNCLYHQISPSRGTKNRHSVVLSRQLGYRIRPLTFFAGSLDWLLFSTLAVSRNF